MFLLHHGENFAAQFDVGLQGIGQRHEFLMGGIRAASGMRVRGKLITQWSDKVRSVEISGLIFCVAFLLDFLL